MEAAMIVYPLLLATQLVFVADTVPQFDAAAGCPPHAVESLLNRSVEACKSDEEGARQTLTQNWDKFQEADRAVCRRMIGMGGSPSYVELLTCLELAQQTKGFRQAHDTGSKL
jgi:hypothetical protein